LPIGYGSIYSSNRAILSLLPLGSALKGQFGVIIRVFGKCSKREAEEQVVRMVEEAFAMRGLELDEVKVAAAEHTVLNIGCAFAAVPLWY
jgi:arginine decarboxylase